MKKLVSTLLAISMLSCGAGALADDAQVPATDSIMTMISELDSTEAQLDALLALRGRIDAMLAELAGDMFTDLERGARGDEVTALQERLAELGYYTANINGKYDNETTKAVKQFEKRNGLDNDGKASAFDQALMFSASAIARDGAPIADEAIVDEPLAVPSEPTSAAAQPAPDVDESKYEELNYADYAAEPDAFAGRLLKAAGSVAQVTSSGARIDVGGDDTIYLDTSALSGVELTVGDAVKIYAELDGEFVYKTLRGATLSLPYARAHAIEIAG